MRAYIYKGAQARYWCPHDETAPAEGREIEYQDYPRTTVYVKFPMKGSTQGKLGHLLTTASCS